MLWTIMNILSTAYLIGYVPYLIVKTFKQSDKISQLNEKIKEKDEQILVLSEAVLKEERLLLEPHREHEDESLPSP